MDITKMTLKAMENLPKTIKKKSFRGFCVGDHILWRIDDFDTVKPVDVPCVVTEIFDDHAIAKSNDNMTLWIDDDTLQDYRKFSK